MIKIAKAFDYNSTKICLYEKNHMYKLKDTPEIILLKYANANFCNSIYVI